MQNYSQVDEQSVILDVFGSKPSAGNEAFLDIGAFDGVTGSNTRALALLGWRGLCVEPDPAQFLQLMEVYRDSKLVKVAHVAVIAGPHNKVVPMNTNSSQCSTLQNRQPAGRPGQTIYVGAVHSGTIARHFGTMWDFISVDVEGLEIEVFCDLQPLISHTKLLCVEDFGENNKIAQAAERFGFKLLRQGRHGASGNSFFIRK